MVYGAYKYLPRETAVVKVLHDKLSAMVCKFFE